jgi:hypothetical protein
MKPRLRIERDQETGRYYVADAKTGKRVSAYTTEGQARNWYRLKGGRKPKAGAAKRKATRR